MIIVGILQFKLFSFFMNQIIFKQNKLKSHNIIKSIKQNMQKRVILKIAVIGAPCSGKSSFIKNLLSKSFSSQYEKTLSYQLSIFRFNKDLIQYQIQLWQCGAQHLSYNKHIRYAFFNNSSAALLMFDLSDPKWKQKIQEWLAEAYQYNCFLIYAIGTKKDVFLSKKYSQIYGQATSENYLTDSLLQSKGIETLDELDINKFFQDFQIRHYYQQATQPIHKQITNIFISIENDQQKISRSSLATGRRFDNTLMDFKGSSKESMSIYTENIMEYSIKLQEQDQSHQKTQRTSKAQKSQKTY